MELFDYMNIFLSSPEPDVDREYIFVEKQYEKMFGHTVPRAMLPDSVGAESIKVAMWTCIEIEKDNLFELLGVEIPDGVLI